MKNLLSLHKRKSMKKLINSVFFIALCSCMAMVSCISDGDDSDTGSIELVAGDKLPVFSVTMNDGRVVTHESLRGKVSFIVFFNTGCKDCRRELPVIQQIYEHHPHMPLIAISRTVYHLFAKSGIPRIYVVDAELTIRSVFTDNPLAGYDELEAAINDASSR